MNPVVEYQQGAQAFLSKQIAVILPDMNADLAAKVDGAIKPAFGYTIGSVPNVKEPRLCCSFVSNIPRRGANNEKFITVGFKIECLVCVAGDNSSSNYEMCRQVSADHLLTLLDDDEKILTPNIHAGLCGDQRAMEAERGILSDIFPRLMMDGTTVCRGWAVPFNLTFSLRTRGQ